MFLSAVRITDPDARTVSVRQFLGEAREAEPQVAVSTGGGKAKAKPTAVVTPQAAGKARGQMKKSSSTAKAKVSTALSNQVLSMGHGVPGATNYNVGVIRNPVATVNCI